MHLHVKNNAFSDNPHYGSADFISPFGYTNINQKANKHHLLLIKHGPAQIKVG